MNYKIFKATTNELDDMYEIQKDENHLLISYNLLKSDLQNKNKLYFVTKDENNKVNAFICISMLIDHIDIDYIIVKKEFRNLKIAASLLNYVISYCKSKKINKLFIEVRTSNTAAIKLYEKFNFENIAVRKNYYPDNSEDAFVYMLKI